MPCLPKWPRGTSHHTTSDSNTTPPCHCSKGAKSSQSEALQMPREHGQWQPHPAGLEETRQMWAASLPLRKGRNMGAINTQIGLLTAREGHEVCSKLSRDEKANTPFDLQSFEHDIFKLLSILLLLKHTKNICCYWALKENTHHISSIRRWSMHIKGMSDNVKL